MLQSCHNVHVYSGNLISTLYDWQSPQEKDERCIGGALATQAICKMLVYAPRSANQQQSLLLKPDLPLLRHYHCHESFIVGS